MDDLRHLKDEEEKDREEVEERKSLVALRVEEMRREDVTLLIEEAIDDTGGG